MGKGLLFASEGELAVIISLSSDLGNTRLPSVVLFHLDKHGRQKAASASGLFVHEARWSEEGIQEEVTKVTRPFALAISADLGRRSGRVEPTRYAAVVLAFLYVALGGLRNARWRNDRLLSPNVYAYLLLKRLRSGHRPVVRLQRGETGRRHWHRKAADWFSEYPGCVRPRCTTGPWSDIKPSLAVLWGVSRECCVGGVRCRGVDSCRCVGCSMMVNNDNTMPSPSPRAGFTSRTPRRSPRGFCSGTKILGTLSDSWSGRQMMSVR